MYQRSIRELNQLIMNQEEMIESYSRMIRDVEDPKLKKILMRIQESHFTQMMVMSDRILELGGNPKFETGLVGVMDDIRYNKGGKDGLTSLENARIALDGERLNIEKLSVFATNEIDSTSLELLQKAVNMQHENISILEEYINDKETLQ